MYPLYDHEPAVYLVPHTVEFSLRSAAEEGFGVVEAPSAGSGAARMNSRRRTRNLKHTDTVVKRNLNVEHENAPLLSSGR